MTRRMLVARTARWVCAAIIAFGCAGATENAQSSGESHFLGYCTSSCGQGLDCISGICTRACLVGAASCSDLHDAATCTNESVEPGSVAVCDLTCQSTSDCAGLGEDHECVDGYCRRGDPTPSPSGGYSGTGGSPGAGGAGGAGGSAEPSCAEYWVTHASEVDLNGSCSACGCGEVGDDSCEELGDCEVGAPIYECPREPELDDISVLSSTIDGDVLTATVQHGGGCAEHRYSLCYRPMVLTSNPLLVGLVLRHDAGGDSCEALLTQTSRFDLKPLAEYVAPFVQDEEHGLVRTNFGMYAWGELTCDERGQLIANRTLELLERTDRSCVSADDCEGVGNSSSCYSDCGTMVASSAVADYMSGLEALEETVCEAYTELGCPAPIPPSCPPGGVVDCVDSVCVLSF